MTCVEVEASPLRIKGVDHRGHVPNLCSDVLFMIVVTRLDSILFAAGQFRGLVTLSKQYGIQAGYHNHEEYIGAQVWDMASVIDALDPKWAGFYFDARPAVAEGGVGGWKIATNLVMPRLRMVAVKDFRWEKLENVWTA